MLWHTEVEDESPSEVATLFGLDANGTRVLASRAREGLKQAYLQAHVSVTLTTDEECARYADRLGAYARGGLRTRAERGLRKHLEECAKCRLAAGQIKEVASGIPAVVPVAVIGWFGAAGYAKAAALIAGGAGEVRRVPRVPRPRRAAAPEGPAPVAGAAAEGLGAPVKAGIAAGVVAAAVAVAVAIALAGDERKPKDRRRQGEPPRRLEPPCPRRRRRPPEGEARAAGRCRSCALAASHAEPHPEADAHPHAHSETDSPAEAEAHASPRTGPEAAPSARPPAVFQLNQLAYGVTRRRHRARDAARREQLGVAAVRPVDRRQVVRERCHRPRDSSVTIDLNRTCTAYDAFVGVDDMTMGTGAVRFSVFADGVRLWKSQVLQGGEGAVPVHVNLAGQARRSGWSSSRRRTSTPSRSRTGRSPVSPVGELLTRRRCH